MPVIWKPRTPVLYYLWVISLTHMASTTNFFVEITKIFFFLKKKGRTEQKPRVTHPMDQCHLYPWVPQHLEGNRATLSSAFSLTKHLLADDTTQSPRFESWKLALIFPFPTTQSFWFYLLKKSQNYPILTTSMTAALIQTLLFIIYTQNILKIDLLSANHIPADHPFLKILLYNYSWYALLYLFQVIRSYITLVIRYYIAY